MKQRILNILIAFDQLVYVLVTFGYGMPDETLSSAAWRTERDGRLGGKIFRPFIDWIFTIQPDHCHRAFQNERRRAQSRIDQPYLNKEIV